MTNKRPVFRKTKKSQSYESPEELFTKLPNRRFSDIRGTACGVGMQGLVGGDDWDGVRSILLAWARLSIMRLDTFSYGFVFALGMAVIRYRYGG